MKNLIQNHNIFKSNDFWVDIIKAKIFSALPLNKIGEKKIQSILES